MDYPCAKFCKMKGLNKSRAEALTTLLNAQIKNKAEINLSVKALIDGSYYVGTVEDKVRILNGDNKDLYKLHIGGNIEKPAVVISGNTYDGIADLFDSIEIVNN